MRRSNGVRRCGCGGTGKKKENMEAGKARQGKGKKFIADPTNQISTLSHNARFRVH